MPSDSITASQTAPTPTHSPAASTEATPNPLRWWILGVILAMNLMDMLDGTVVNVAAPTIHHSLHTSTTALQWIISGYPLAMAVGLLVGARLGDIYGRRVMFIVGIAGFTIASAVCGAAPDTTVLVIARLVQGAGGALMMPQGFGLLREVFSEKELPKVFGLFGPVLGMGAMVGPIIGGVLVQAHILHAAWRPVFLINVPIGVLAVIAGAVLLPRTDVRHAKSLDLVGALLASAASLALVYPLIQGREAGWPAWTYAMIAASVVLFGAFGWHITHTRREPLILPSIFANRGYSSGVTLLMVYFGAMTGAIVALTLFFQLGEHFSALHSGLTLIPFSLGIAVSAPIATGQMERFGGRALIQAGGVLSLIGYAATAVVIPNVGHVTTWTVAGPLFVVGIGMSLFAMSAFSTILAAVDDAELGSASGSLEAIQQLGSGLGTAVLGTVFFSTLSHHGFHPALSHAMWWAVGAAVIALVLTPLLPRESRSEADLLG